jgi:Na+-driven multidrug efflux pump
MVMINLSGLLLMVFVAAWGTYTVAAYGIGMRLNMAAMIPVMGLGFASATLVGQNLGAKKSNRAEKSGWLCALIGTIVMGSLSALFLLLPREVIAFFSDNLEVISIGEQFIRWVAPTLAFIGLAITLGRGLGGAGDTFHPMIFTAVSLLVIRVSLAGWLPNQLGLIGIWIALASTNIIHGALVTIWFKVGKWKRKVI